MTVAGADDVTLLEQALKRYKWKIDRERLSITSPPSHLKEPEELVEALMILTRSHGYEVDRL